MRLARHFLNVAAAAALLPLAGCGRGSSVTTDTVQKTPSEVVATNKHAVTLTVVDARTGSLVTSPVTLSVEGALANSLYDGFGKKISTVSTLNGVASFYVPDTGSLNVVANADGYFVGGTSVDIRDSLVRGNIQLVNLSKLPEGVTLGASSASTSSTGAVTEDVKASASTSAGTTAVDVPEGTVLKAADGSILKGELDLTVLAFDVDSIKSLAALPGGSSVVKDGKEEPLQFLGVLGLALTDANGEAAATANPPLELSVPVSADVSNPITGAKFAAGDSVDIVGFDEATGTWKVIGASVVSAPAARTKANPTLVIKFVLSQLWRYIGVRVRLPASLSGICEPLYVSLPGMETVNVNLYTKAPGHYAEASSLGFTRVAIDVAPKQEQVLHASWGTSSEYALTGTWNCGDAVTLDLQKSPAEVSETFIVMGVCKQGGATEGLKALDLTVTQNGTFVTTVRTDDNGQAVVSGLASGGQYSYSVIIDKTNTVQGSFLAGGNSTVISTSVDCPEVTGATGASGD